jgi:hypothetical protein
MSPKLHDLFGRSGEPAHRHAVSLSPLQQSHRLEELKTKRLVPQPGRDLARDGS